MKISIQDGCIGCGLCAGTCSEVFRMNDDGLAEVMTLSPSPSEKTTAQEAADGCPVSVIMIEN